MFFIKNKIKLFAVLLVIFLPTLLLAAEATTGTATRFGIPATPGNLKALICIIVFLALDFVPYIIVLAVCAFIMGLIKYIGNGDNEEKRGEGNKLMIYGIVGLFFMLSIWGILSIFTASFNLPLGVPQFKTDDSSSQSCERTNDATDTSGYNNNVDGWFDD